MIHTKRILVVDGDRDYARRLCTVLKREQFTALGPAPTAFYAEQLLGRRSVDAVVIDAAQLGDAALKLAVALKNRGIAVLPFGSDEPKFSKLPPKPTRPEEAVALVRRVLGADPVAPARRAPELAEARAENHTDHHSRMARTIGRLLRGNDTSSPRF